METATIFNCTTIWTNDTLIDLGERVADDGFGPWEASIAELVAAARARHIALVMADVLGNLTVPAPVRARAFARVVSAMVTSALPESMRRGVDARGHRTSGVLLGGAVA